MNTEQAFRRLTTQYIRDDRAVVAAECVPQSAEFVALHQLGSAGSGGLSSENEWHDDVRVREYSTVYFVRQVLCAWVVLGLAACGGGGGDGDSGGQFSVALSTNSVSFQSQQYSTVSLPPQTIDATARNGSVYIDLAGYSFAGVTCPGTNRCTITINAPSTSSPLQPGTYNHSLSVRLCSDPYCNSVVSTETVTIRHTVVPGVQLTTPGAVDLAADQGQSALQSLALNFANGTPTSISAVASYPAGNGSGWLTLNPTLSTLNVSASALEPETYRATIALTYSGTGFSNTVDIPVTYTIRAAPSVEHVVPHTAVTNEARSVVIRGKGFDRLTRPVRFGGVDAQEVTRISDTELRVTPPTFATPGVYTVDIPNDVGITTGTAEFVVVAPQPYAPAAVNISNASSGGLLYKQVIYDAQRQAVYFTKDATPSRARFVGGAWVVEPLPGAPSGRMSASTDGSKLYFVNRTTASEYDLNRDSITRTYADVAHDVVYEIVMLNDGRGLTHRMGSARLTNFALGRTTDLNFSTIYTWYSVASPDLGKVLLLRESADRDLSAFDVSRQAFARFETPTNVGVNQVAINRHATRIVAGEHVYDGSYALLGSLTGWAGASGITTSPDGTRVYVVSYFISPTYRTTLQTFDISAATGPYPQLGPTITLPDFSGYAPAIAIAPDGLTVFIVGNERFIVMPTPP